MVQIDNTKMWATILYYLEDYRGSTVSLSSIIKQALKDQGFKWDGEHIVPLEPELESEFDLEEGKWYKCIEEVVNQNHVTAFEIGGIYYCPQKNTLDIKGLYWHLDQEVMIRKCFRQVTEEEIKKIKEG